MTYDIQKITDREMWEGFLREVRPDTFLQSWGWGSFQESQGDSVVRFGIFTQERLCAVALFIEVHARRGRFLLCPHGPVIHPSYAQQTERFLTQFFEAARATAKDRHIDFIRVASLLFDTPAPRAFFSRQGFRPSPIHVHPELAWILDISPDEEALTAGMRKTTRYSIRKAEKDGVTVTMTRNMSAIDTFYRIYKETEQRQHFVAFSRDYIEKELKAFSIDTESEAQLFFAEYGGSVLATALIIFTPWQAFYHQGASSSGNSKIPASYLLQWRVIQEARRRGCTAYNFWGVSPLGRERHPWAGLSLFKRGFGGREEAYLHAQDLVLRPRYWLTYALETVRNKKRGF